MYSTLKDPPNRSLSYSSMVWERKGESANRIQASARHSTNTHEKSICIVDAPKRCGRQIEDNAAGKAGYNKIRIVQRQKIKWRKYRHHSSTYSSAPSASYIVLSITREQDRWKPLGEGENVRNITVYDRILAHTRQISNPMGRVAENLRRELWSKMTISKVVVKT